MDDESTLTDEDLVLAFRDSGVSAHLDRLFSRNIPTVRAMIYQMVLNHADADELTQEVFVRVARGIDRFNSKACFSTWLHRIVMNCTKTFISRRARHTVDFHESPPEMPADSCSRPDLAVSAAEVDGRIQQALASLRPKLRAAVVLTMIQNVPLPEAARIEGCALPTMYWRVHEARRQLKHLLKECLS
jgi:RNA polymerase sigma-70 factor (ECF subfamily)